MNYLLWLKIDFINFILVKKSICIDILLLDSELKYKFECKSLRFEAKVICLFGFMVTKII
jgi:hypothetical protein